MDDFKRSPDFLLRYCLITVAVFLGLDALLICVFPPSLALAPGPWDLLWTTAGLLLCGLPSSILHNCAHGNTGGPRLNKALGEICGTIMLYGFESFRTGHMLHHRYPDNPEYDPHPPEGISFPAFLVAPVKATLVVIERAYFETHGRNAETERKIRWQKLLFKASLGLKVAFWLLLLGPQLFLVLYLPMYLSNLFVFAHINYATHIEGPDGYRQIVNLNHNAYYRLANFLSLGGYFHKNHHSRPRLFNPAKLAAPDKPLLTHRPGRPFPRFEARRGMAGAACP